VALGVTWALTSWSDATAQSRKPNVLLILTDDQGTLDANCYGSNDLFTPHMDALASAGVRFTQAYAHTVCCPSRALLLTGRHPQRSNVNNWQQGMLHSPKPRPNMYRSELTIAEILRQAGYRTGLFGKWHLGAHPDHGPREQGFEEFFGLRDGFIDNYNHYFLHGTGYHDLYRGTVEVFRRGRYFPDLMVEEAVEFIDTHRDRPFFLYVPFNIPHYPEQADSKFDKRYANLPSPRREYARMISTTDDRIGTILEKLDSTGLRDDTIICFMSDNGHSAETASIKVENHTSGYPRGHNYGSNSGGGNTGKWRGAKGSFFEGGIRVPAILSYPRSLPSGIVRDQVVSAADMLPTILELTGVPLPDVQLDGKSLLPIIRSSTAPSHHSVLHWQWKRSWAVREGDWKLIFNGKDSTDAFGGLPEPRRKIPEIFLGNLAETNPELANHAGERPEIVKRLTKLHETWSADVFARPNILPEKARTLAQWPDAFRRRGGLENSRIRFAHEKTAHVAFLGGSITEMGGFRPLVMELLKRRFPDTDFTFTNAGIGSTCSTTGAFRLPADVLEKGSVDLLFVEFAVNDDQDAHHCADTAVRGMEGIVRQARRYNPRMDIIMIHFVNPGMMELIQKGEMPVAIAAHEKVAQHCRVSSIPLTERVAEHVTGGRLTWEEFGGTHPGPFGNALCAATIDALLEEAWSGPLNADAKKKDYSMPERPLDSLSYDKGRFRSPEEADVKRGWTWAVPDWESLAGKKRQRFLDVKLLSADTPGAKLTLDFTGNAIGAYVLAGPDAGIVEVSIDDGPFEAFDLFHRFSRKLHYPRTVTFRSDLPPGQHRLRLRLTANSTSGGHAARILQFVENAASSTDGSQSSF